MTPVAVRIPDRHLWLRVAQGDWEDPLDTTFAEQRGGRWSSPSSFPVLHLNADLYTARAQILALLEGQPVRPEDLDDDAYTLVAATLPGRQDVADAVSPGGLAALGLPDSYPFDGRGARIGWGACQPIGALVHASPARCQLPVRRNVRRHRGRARMVPGTTLVAREAGRASGAVAGMVARGGRGPPVRNGFVPHRFFVATHGDETWLTTRSDL